MDCQEGTYGDGHGETNEEHVDWKVDRDKARLIAESVIQPPGNSAAQAKW